MKTLAADGRARDKRWAVVRLLLGLAQCFGAVFSAVLLFEIGITAASLAAAWITTPFAAAVAAVSYLALHAVSR